MSFKRKKSAPTRVVVDLDTGRSDTDAAVDGDVTVAPATDHDYDSDQSHDRSLRVVTSPSSLSADDDDDDDVTRPDDVAVPASCAVGGLPPDDEARGQCVDTPASQRPWLCAEVASVLTKMQAVIADAPSLDEKRRRVDDMLTELETIRRHLLMAQSHIAATSPRVSVT